MTDLDDQLRQHYRNLSLPEEALASLIETYERSSKSEHTSWSRRLADRLRITHRPTIGVLGIVVLVLAILFGFRFSLSVDRSEQLLKEVALNHATRFEPDVEASSLALLDQQMALLPFNLELPDLIRREYAVRGARYCSLSGQLAVHLEMEHRKTGKVASVFLTRAADDLKVISDQTKSVDGISMRIWRESGYFYVWAGSSDLGA